MEMKQLAVRFTDTAAEEVKALVGDLQLLPVAQYLQKTDQPLPDELKALLMKMLGTISDLFSVDLPMVERDPEATLRAISRDINLARLLRERGMFRLYRLIHQTDRNNLPLYTSMFNPDSGAPFAKQEEFIGWFCQEAHVARSLTFQRLGTIEKILDLGMTLEEAFGLVVSKPYAIYETFQSLKQVATWVKGELVAVNDPDLVLQMAGRVAPGAVPQLAAMAEAARANPEDADAQQALVDAARPVIAGLLSEVAEHNNAKDALDFVKFDILRQPEINYRWDDESSVLWVEYIRMVIDPNSGLDRVDEVQKIPFIPDVLSLPKPVRDDLVKRLPMKNRNNLHT